MKKQYFTDKISACQGNIKESWKTVNELLNKRSKSSNIRCLQEVGTENIHKKGISDAMNSFFCYIGKELANIGVLAGKRSLIKKRRARIATIIMLVYFIPSDKSIKYISTNPC